MEIVVAHAERATLRVDDVFLKIDADQSRMEAEVAATALAPIPVPEILWHRPPVLALAALRGEPIVRLGRPSDSSPSACTAVGAAIQALHDAPLPTRSGPGLEEVVARLDTECEALVRTGVLPAELVERNRAVAQAALRPWTLVFVHGDLQPGHVFVEGDTFVGVLDWSEAAQGAAAADSATLIVGFADRLPDVLAGYGNGVDVAAIRGWWSIRSLSIIRWLLDHGFDPFAPGGEVDVLRAAA